MRISSRFEREKAVRSQEPPIRVVQLLTRMNVGGPARQVLSTARSLGPEFDVTVAAGRAPAVEGSLTDPDVAVVAVPLVRPLRPRQDLAALGAVRRLLQSQRPAILHTHMAKAGTVGRVAALSLQSRPRTVHTFHGHVLAGYFSPSVQRAFLEAERRLAARTDVLVAVSVEIRDELLSLGIGRTEQYEVVPVGIDLDLFAPNDHTRGRLRRQLDLDAATPLVGIVARLAEIKDHAALFAAIRQLPEVHLAVLGDGELRHALEARATRLGIGNRVHFTGWWHDMPAALADLDVVALSSRNEGTPYSLIEAAAAGTPVVATDVGGVRSVVLDGETGYLVPPGDAASLADAIKALTDDPHTRRRLGTAGRDLARSRFGERTCADALAGLYRRLVST